MVESIQDRALREYIDTMYSDPKPPMPFTAYEEAWRDKYGTEWPNR